LGAVGFTFGVEGLDKIIGSALEPGVLIAVEGHPGSGKTTLASTICYHNALRGHRCLYFSLQEGRRKLFRNMRRLGMDLEGLESRGLIRFVKMHIQARTEPAEALVSGIAKLVNEWKPRVVVVDSISALFSVLEGSPEVRALLQNYFSELAEAIEGLVVLIAEVPYGSNEPMLRSIEFVADVILNIRHSIHDSLLVRELEIKKARGASVTIARLPFSIIEGVGLKVFIPPVLSEIPAIDVSRAYRQPCSRLEKLVGCFHAGENVYVTHPVEASPHTPIWYLASIAYVNKARLLVITYRHSPDTLLQIMGAAPLEGGASGELMGYFEREVEVLAFNPSAYSLEELYVRELQAIEKLKPDIVAFLGLEALTPHYKPRELANLKRNQVLLLKKLGVLTFNVGASSSEEFHILNSSLADTIVKYHYLGGDSGRGRSILISRPGRDPIKVLEDDMLECIEEAIRQAS